METVIRIVLVYIAIVIGLRILGKREFGQLSPLELVTLLLIPEIITPVLHRDNPSVTNSLLGLATLFGLVFITSALLHRSQRLENILAGSPALVVAHGEMLPDTMNKERVTPDEILAEMHKSGLDRLSQVKWAVLESDGKISIVAEDHARPQTHYPEESSHIG